MSFWHFWNTVTSSFYLSCPLHCVLALEYGLFLYFWLVTDPNTVIQEIQLGILGLSNIYGSILEGEVAKCILSESVYPTTPTDSWIIVEYEYFNVHDQMMFTISEQRSCWECWHLFHEFYFRYINIDDCWLAHERDRYVTILNCSIDILSFLL